MPDKTVELTENETKIVDQIRTLKPYETLSIMADAQGRPDSFLITRSHKVLLIVNQQMQYVRGKPGQDFAQAQ